MGRWNLVLLASLAAAALTSFDAEAATPAPVEIATQLALPTVRAPHQRDGHPDFQGSWNRYPDLLISAQLPDQPKAGDPLATPRRQPRPPLKPAYQAILEQRWKAAGEAAARNQPLAERSVACIPDGMPNMMRAAWIMEIIQTPEQINIGQELYNQIRRIYMRETLPSIDELDPGFYGRSIGRFEGQTLVIETAGIREDVLASSGGPGSAGGGDVPHSPQMKIEERLRYVAPNILQDAITITDPETMTGPWTMVYHYRKMPADYKWQEYVCEANRVGADENGIQRRLDVEGSDRPAR
jgi:hypothetical protein